MMCRKILGLLKSMALFPLLTVILFFGCTTPAPVPAPVTPAPLPETIIVQSPPETLMPLTVGILQRLFDSNEQLSNEIGNYQLILFGRIYLERNYTQSTNRLEAGGRITFEDLHIREQITILDQTEGQAMNLEIVDNEIVLSVCFEREDRYISCQLEFTSMAWDTEGYFYLKYSPNGRTSVTAEERGVLQYGGPEYKLKFTGDKSPYLLIKLTQRDTDRVNARTASGRKVL